jgi:hypothetical protein
MSTMEFYILFVIVGFIIAILADSPFSISKERMKSIKEAAKLEDKYARQKYLSDEYARHKAKTLARHRKYIDNKKKKKSKKVKKRKKRKK